ncbi:MAG TPA: choice-of-anchor D domain-containing protein [Ktedonobacterales bacterium]
MALLFFVISGLVFVQAPQVAKAAASATLNPIQTENQQPGSTGWQFDVDSTGTPLKATHHEIEGYASLTSVNQGSQISFMVNLSSNAQYVMDIYRMGYYPSGTNPDGSPCVGACGGRFMQEVGPLNGTPQPGCPTSTASATLNMIECNWAAAYTLAVPTTWTTGTYIVKLKRLDDKLESYMTFVVRNDSGPADIVLSEDVTTWQAYNFWGGAGNKDIGYSLYAEINDVTFNSAGNGRAYAVSFDRPYMDQGAQDGAGNFMVWDYPMVRWLEAQGYNVTYATDVDLETNPNLLNGRKALINTGHDEYYSANMRANIKSYINAGANIGFFSANNIYWRVTWGASTSGQSYRRIFCPKDATIDPTDIRWRDMSPPLPENAIVGVMQNGTANNRDYEVYDATSWIYAGTGLVNYTGKEVTSGSGQNAIPGIIGYEFDENAKNDSTLSSFVPYAPTGLQQVGHSAVPAVDNGVAAFSDATVYTASSGAIVFAAGTIQWSWGVDNGFNDGYCDCNPGYASTQAKQITANILNRFISGSGAAPAPSVSLTPTSLTFANQTLGTTSGGQSVLLTNSGTAALSITSIGITGTNAGDFAQTNTCPTGSSTLAAGANCSISVTFSPTASGTRTASLSIADNANGSPQTVSLTGSGVSATDPAVTLNPTSINFGGQNIGSTSAPQAVTLTNSGNGALSVTSISLTGTNASDFAQTNTCPTGANTLAVGASCTISVTFSPTASGARTASVSIADNAPNTPQSVALSGNGAVAGTYFVEGFESGNFGQWTGPTGTGKATVQTAVVNTGTNAAQLTNTSGQYVTLSANLAGGAQTSTYTRFYFRFASGVGTTPIAQGRNAAGANLWEVDYDASRQGLDIYFWNGAGTRSDLYTNVNVLAANTWYSIEVQSNETTTGQGQVWLNGAPVGVVNTDLSTTSAYSQLTLYSDAVGSTYIDDIQVANTYNGPIGGTTSAPAVSLSPTSLGFSSENVGVTTPAQTVTLKNSGNAALSITGIALAGANPGDFAQTNTCPTGASTLAAGASCSISVTFTPTTTGTRTASLTITDNAAGSPQSVSLSGNGVTAGTYFSDGFESGNFGQWTGPTGPGSATVQTAVVNSGTYAAQLTNTSGQYVNLTAPLVGGAQSNTYTRFYFRLVGGTSTTPILEGRNASNQPMWEVDYDAGRQGLDIYFWNGAGTRSDLYTNTNVISPNTWYSIEVHDTEATSGVGQAWLNGTSIGSVSGDLSTTSAFSSLYLYSQAVDTMYFDDFKVANTYNGPLGYVPAPAVTLNPSSLTFSSQTVATTSAAQSVTLTNSGAAALSISSIALSGTNATDFAQTNTCPTGTSTLAAGANCTISVTFTPSATGTRTASVTISDNATGSPHSVSLTGTGATAPAPVTTISPTSVSFGTQTVGASTAAQTVTLTNSGNAPMSVTGIALSGTNAGDFAQTNTCPTGASTLAAGASCSISVTFTPTATGSRVASLTITDNAAGSPQSVSLSGNALAVGTYFSDGFESGNFGQWTGPTGPGSATVQTAVVNSGTYAAQLTNTSGQYVYLTAPLVGGAQSATYTKFYFRLVGGASTTPILEGRNASNQPMWEVDYDAGRQGLDIYFWNGARVRSSILSRKNLIKANTWYSIEVQDTEATSGVGQAWVNGTSIGSVSGDLSTTSAFSSLYLYSEAVDTLYFDDIRVSNAF